MRELSVNWNPATAMRFEATDERGNTVVMDSTREHGGDEAGFSPKIMLLVSLGGCTGMDVISILRKMRQEVTGYHVELKGWEREEHPQKYDRIIIEHVIEGHNLN